MSQEAIGWLLAIYAGALVGWVAEQLTIVRHGTLITTLAGMAGAVVGNLAYSLVAPSDVALNQIVVGVVSALGVIALMPRRKRHSHPHSETTSASRSAAWKMYAMKK